MFLVLKHNIRQDKSRAICTAFVFGKRSHRELGSIIGEQM